MELKSTWYGLTISNKDDVILTLEVLELSGFEISSLWNSSFEWFLNYHTIWVFTNTVTVYVRHAWLQRKG